MRKNVVTLLLVLISISMSSQSLLDIYKSGTVYLQPDSEYGAGNDWDDLLACLCFLPGICAATF